MLSREGRFHLLKPVSTYESHHQAFECDDILLSSDEISLEQALDYLLERDLVAYLVALMSLTEMLKVRKN
jgi:hypothetical protein